MDKLSKFESDFYKKTHGAVSITSEDVDPLHKVRKSRPLDLNPYARIPEKSKNDANEIIYRQLPNGDYILQPRYMLDSGSMCVTELYSKKQRIKLVHEILFKEKMQSKQERLPMIRKITYEKGKIIENNDKKGIRELIQKKRKFDEINEELAMKRKQEQEKKLRWKNKLLVPYEKRYLWKNYNTDVKGSLLKNQTLAQKQLRNSTYLRAELYIKQRDSIHENNTDSKSKLKKSRNKEYTKTAAQIKTLKEIMLRNSKTNSYGKLRKSMVLKQKFMESFDLGIFFHKHHF